MTIEQTLPHRPAGRAMAIGGRVADVAGFLLYVGTYVGLIAWFKWFDVYHTRFEIPGRAVIVYNLFRVLFIIYLFWMVHAVGTVVLRLIAGREPIGGYLERLALGFFAGTGIWHVAMLVLGFLGLYKVEVAAAVTLPLVALSYVNVRNSWVDGFHIIAGAMRDARALSPLGWLRVVLATPLACLLLVAVGSLLLVKGLYPAGGHDYYTHYFQYYKTVIDRGDLWPNEVWYHFYYSKGAGLYFLGMLITDALAPQLVTFCFVIAAAMALYLLLRRISGSALWSLVGVILYVGCYIYTPGPDLNRSHGGWGDFEKLHELSAALIIAVIWATAGACEHSGRKGLAWAAAAASATAAATIVSLSIAGFLGAIFVLIILASGIRRQWRNAALGFGLACVAGATLVALLAVNQVMTGLANDQGILFFWQFANLDRLDQWGALSLVIYLHWAITGLVANSVPLSRETVYFLSEALRLELVYPLVGLGLLAVVLSVVLRRSRLPARNQIMALAAAVAVFCVLAILAGRSQPISFYRYSSFALPVVIAAGVALWQVPLEPKNLFRRAVWTMIVPLAVLAACMVTIFRSYPGGPFEAVHINAWRFARGLYSIDTAYTTQGGWPGRLPWGGIHPGARGAYGVVGPHKRIWSFHIHHYCMLPDCTIGLDSSFIATRHLDRVLYGTPDQGRDTLREAGIDYFLFSRDLAIFGYMVVGSPLFHPDTIGKYLGIRWTDGQTALLTWLGPDTTPLDEAWLADYRRLHGAWKRNEGYPYDAMRKILETLHRTPHPWRSFELPWHGNRPY